MYDVLKNSEIFRETEQKLSDISTPLCICGCIDSQKIQLAKKLADNDGWSLYITKDDRTAEEALTDFNTFSDNVYLYPAKDLLFYSSDVHSGYIGNLRTVALKHIMQDRKGIVIAPVEALMDRVVSSSEMKNFILKIGEGMIFEQTKLLKMLDEMGYEREFQTEQMGQYSIRGGILDIYPFTSEQPYRIEFFDDEVDTVRSFNKDTQCSGDRIKKIEIYPSGDTVNTKKVSFISYFKDNEHIIMDEPSAICETLSRVWQEYNISREKRADAKLSEEFSVDPGIYSADEVLEMLPKNRRLILMTFEQNVPGVFGKTEKININAVSTGSYKKSLEYLIKDMQELVKKNYRITVLTPSQTRRSGLAERLREYGIKAYVPDENKDVLKEGEVEVCLGGLKSGFIYPDEKYALFTESDMFGKKYRAKKHRKNENAIKISSLEELEKGDYVVHEAHGIGIYRGLEKIVKEDAARDYITIEYEKGDKLYLPAAKLSLIQKYASADSKKPKLSKLNGAEWQRIKERALHAAEGMAKELIELYAKRSRPNGFRYSPDTVWQKEFEEMFPYEETDDQLNAIEAVKADMESSKIMDRLICGDVGFGKTEIALRAAFKAVQEGKQVAYLVPTTILAKQHYDTFTERMKSFPVKIEMMSRFKTSSENKETALNLKSGYTDIVIGTHRILSKDVGFKDLGLLIIDEEQRFGVAHKEKIKQLRYDVDVLTLTATPIPRTLHMSLSGIRELSLLNEPPLDRIPVQTYVMEYNDELVREAVKRETARNGQVFYVYNKIKGIEEKTENLRKLLPDVNVEYAHGQMDEYELERIMGDFVDGSIDVLVSTTIIETGLDIPNANTLIIDGAERMGLSQLYQIRGRVGRSGRNAFAFFMYRKDRIISEEAGKRLKAIKEFAQLGAGIKIAMKDLELRGAGNVLGTEQHGQMEAVGYELYVKMLSHAVKLLQGKEAAKDSFDTFIDADIDAFLPEEYIPGEKQRLDIYKRIADIQTIDDKEEMQDELIDRFGDLPGQVENLLYIAMLKVKAHKAFVTELNIKINGFTMNMYAAAEINTAVIPELIEKEKGMLKLIRGSMPRFIYNDTKRKFPDCFPVLKKAEEIIEKITLRP